MVIKTSSLVDPSTGKPLQYQVLDREIAGPTLTGMRPVLSGHPAQGLDPGRLASILRQAEQGDATAYFELAEEIEEKDAHYAGVLGVRKRSVTQLEITVEAAGDDAASQAHADLIRDYLDRDELEGELFDILDAIGKAISYTELIWERSVTPWMPKLKTRDPRFFEFDQVDGETPLLKGGTDGNAGLPEPLPPYKFIVHRHAFKTGQTVRGGLARVMAWPYLFKNFALKDWVIFAEIYGIPMRVGKYDASATEEERRTLLRAVASIGNDAAGIIPRSMEIEFVNAMASGNAEVFQNLCEYLDMQISKAVLGQTGSTDATTGGFGSSGAVHNDVRQDIQRADAKALAATLNRDLVRPMVFLNFGEPAKGKYPRIKIGQAETFSLENFEMIERFAKGGGRVEESVVADKMGLPDAPEPTEGKEVRFWGAPKETPPAGQDGTPGSAEDGTGATRPPKSPLSGLKRPLSVEGSPTALAAGDAEAKDAIDGLVEATESEWTEVMAPMLDEVFDLVDGAASIEDIRTGLIGALEKMDAGKMTDLLARAGYSARLAGEADLDIRGDGPPSSSEAVGQTT
ncbi:hypothetical protein ABI_08730 [Asticcacaulis biprosthecium C19]|uniref:DUF935 domain-containing protein n=1 Tax=Asticcacaulis biprosthecium C19 TaxID=715226 RepID=F4QGA9_9CAUL|nr:DUF935 domain-containing protein [Asticcacaulis biprosthecium]EGF92437.1 hypothetical protein ABI_08730 [Asticcacaulis biprosthecium C19]